MNDRIDAQMDEGMERRMRQQTERSHVKMIRKNANMNEKMGQCQARINDAHHSNSKQHNDGATYITSSGPKATYSHDMK